MTTDSKEASYKTLNEAPLTRNTRFYFQIQYVFHRAVLKLSLLCYKLQVETAMLSVWCSVRMGIMPGIRVCQTLHTIVELLFEMFCSQI